MEEQKLIKVGSDFSGVGAFNQALIRLDVPFKEVYACDMDKYARQTFILNYGDPDYFPENVYDREIPSEPLDIYMTSPPCQAFSLAGKRKGEDDKRGVLFYNSHEFIQKNKPRYFIFENVKGLLSDDGGKTFQRWIDLLSGKSVNGTPVLFPNEESTPYHVYYKVLNAKEFNIPQNRERIFIIGIRDDSDNTFMWPKEMELKERLRDRLEPEVDEKYFLSDIMLEKLTFNGNIKGCVADVNKGGERGSVYSLESDFMSCLSATDYKQPKQIIIKSNTKKGFDIATENDSINFSQPNSETRRGRVGVAQTLDTQCNQGVIHYDYPKVKIQLKGGKWDKTHEQSGRVYDENGIGPTIHTMGGGNQEPKVCIPVLTPDRIEKRQNGRRFKEDGEEMFTITTQDRHGILDGFKIRKLTPRECFRLMDFPDEFKWSVADSQAYKQAGNSICVGVLSAILSRLNLNHS